MSELPHEQNTVKSYVVGLLLSLLFTIIPYYLVVTRSVSAAALLAVILGFATLQMITQVVFFLHLGRGPKPLYNTAFFISTVSIILVVVGGSIFIMNHLHYNMNPAQTSQQLAQTEAIYQIGGKQTGACQGTNTNHKITIQNGKLSPFYITAYTCDTLTFINKDQTLREITFGTHPQHGTYGGETELLLRPGRGKSLTLNQSGTYQFHDHRHPEIMGSFTVLSQP